MQFNSPQFLIFFPIVLVLYYVLPKKLRTVWLLAASYYFYMSWNPKYSLLIGASTVITWSCGLLIEKYRLAGLKNRMKYVVAAGIVSNLSILALFKYADFILSSLDRAAFLLNGGHIDFRFDFLLPVGISFYTFQALGYIIDVYRGEIDAERSFIRYALFVSFFPQLVAGPIERSKNLLVQIRSIEKTERLWSYGSILRGLCLMIYGCFVKVVLADRLGIIVDKVFDGCDAYGTLMLALGAVAFSFQIYCDFFGYSLIAMGAARMMGIRLMENFNAPYFSENVREFWNRWHISLSGWLKEYVYFPLGGSRCSKARNYFNLMITFLISGIWHGAGWKYIFWGGIHGVFQIVSRMWAGFGKRPPHHQDPGKNGHITGLFKRLVTFFLVTFAWVFFRADSLKHAFLYLSRMFGCPDHGYFVTDEFYAVFESGWEPVILMAGLVILLVVDLIRKKGSMIDEFLTGRPMLLRMAVLLCLVFMIVRFGAYGDDIYSQPFIYFQF